MKKLLSIAVFFFMFVFVMAGCNSNKNNAEQSIVYIEVEKEVEVEKPVYIEVEKPVYIETTVEVEKEVVVEKPIYITEQIETIKEVEVWKPVYVEIEKVVEKETIKEVRENYNITYGDSKDYLKNIGTVGYKFDYLAVWNASNNTAACYGSYILSASSLNSSMASTGIDDLLNLSCYPSNKGYSYNDFVANCANRTSPSKYIDGRDWVDVQMGYHILINATVKYVNTTTTTYGGNPIKQIIIEYEDVKTPTQLLSNRQYIDHEKCDGLKELHSMNVGGILHDCFISRENFNNWTKQLKSAGYWITNYDSQISYFFKPYQTGLDCYEKAILATIKLEEVYWYGSAKSIGYKFSIVDYQEVMHDDRGFYIHE